MPDIVPSVIHILTHLILTTTIWNRQFLYPFVVCHPDSPLGRKDIFLPPTGRWPSAIRCLWRVPWLKNTASPKVIPLSRSSPDPVINYNVGVKSWSSCTKMGKMQRYPSSRSLRGLAENFLGIASELNFSFCPILLPILSVLIPKSTP